ncbi:Protein png1 [Coniothyrium glycines]
MKVLSSIRRSRTLRNVNVRASAPAQGWPNPQKSAGRFILKIGQLNCWEAIGPARAVFTKLGQEIKLYLDKYSEPTPSWITWSMYMLGSTPETAIPTIIFCSADEAHRKRIRNTVRDGNLLKDYAGVALKHLPRAPDYDQLVQLASAPCADQKFSSGSYRDLCDSAVYSPSHSTINERYQTPGKRLYIRPPAAHTPPRKATAGTAIQLFGRSCLTTAAHAFQDVSMPVPEGEQADEDLFFSDSDDDEGSFSVASCESNSSSQFIDRGSELYFPRSARSEELTFTSKVATDEDTDTDLSMSEPSKSAADWDQTPPLGDLVGHPIYSSLEDDQSNLDYALIRVITDDTRSLTRYMADPDAVHFPPYTSATELQCITNRTDDIEVHTSSTGVISGSISGTPSYIRAPSASTYQESYQIRTDKALANGDCGSWVIDSKTRKLHGHIIAGSPNLGIAYVIPAHAIFHDIRLHLDLIYQRLARVEQVQQPVYSPSVSERVWDEFRQDGNATSTNDDGTYDKPKSQDDSSCMEILPSYSKFLDDKNTIPPCGSSNTTALQHRNKSISDVSDRSNIIEESHASNSEQLSATEGIPVHDSSVDLQERTHISMEEDIKKLAEQFRSMLSEHRIQKLRNVIISDGRPVTSSFGNIPLMPVPPSSVRSLRFRNMLTSLSNMPLKWENPGLLDEALCKVPLEQIYSEAEEESNIMKAEAESLNPPKKPAWGYQECVVRALMRWFKRDFFSWVNYPSCSRCNSGTASVGMISPTDDERARGASQVEAYKCSNPTCGGYERFPRYSDPFVLLETRKGRCGEWTNCFGMLCRAVGSRVRWVWNAEDSVWVEIYSDHRRRWVAVDACEESWDKPCLYTEGWGKKLSYCIAFSVDGAEDVTRRYVRQLSHAAERTRCTEAELLHIVEAIRTIRTEKMSKEDRLKLEAERVREQKELRGYVISAIIRDICDWRFGQLADGSVGLATSSLHTKDKAGEHKKIESAEWVKAREETGHSPDRKIE